MQIGSVTQTANQNSAEPANQLTGDAFIALLVAQLKAQNPLEPMNPNEFMGQLVQFNTLEQLIQIRQLLEISITSGAADTATTSLANQG